MRALLLGIVLGASALGIYFNSLSRPILDVKWIRSCKGSVEVEGAAPWSLYECTAMDIHYQLVR